MMKRGHCWMMLRLWVCAGRYACVKAGLWAWCPTLGLSKHRGKPLCESPSRCSLVCAQEILNLNSFTLTVVMWHVLFSRPLYVLQLCTAQRFKLGCTMQVWTLKPCVCGSVVQQCCCQTHTSLWIEIPELIQSLSISCCVEVGLHNFLHSCLHGIVASREAHVMNNSSPNFWSSHPLL